MTSLAIVAPSASTRGESGGFVAVLSAATTGAQDVLSAAKPPATRTFVRQHVGRLMIATTAPFAALDDVLFLGRGETATTLSGVTFATEDDPAVHEQPDILTIAPRRTTLKFRSGRRARRLPPRKPFVSVSDPGDA